MTRGPNRRSWQNPDQILHQIGLATGMTFVDMGCGDGFFAVPAAKKVGPTGRVYAVDIDPNAIARLQRAAQRYGVENVVTRVGAAEETVFCESCADHVFLGIVLHDFRDPNLVLQNASRMLKPAGKLVDLDWKRIHMGFGPPYEIRFDENKAVALIRKNSFTIEEVKDSGKYHYLVTARPPQASIDRVEGLSDTRKPIRR